MTSEKFHRLFGGGPQPAAFLTQRDMDLAASVQVVCEEDAQMRAASASSYAHEEPCASRRSRAQLCSGNRQDSSRRTVRTGLGPTGGGGRRRSARRRAVDLASRAGTAANVKSKTGRALLPVVGTGQFREQDEVIDFSGMNPVHATTLKTRKNWLERVVRSDGGRKGGGVVPRSHGIWTASTWCAFDHR